jgi:hypothetical protein
MIRQPEIVSVRLTELELMTLDAICKQHKVNRHEYVRAIVIDALIEDGLNALRCRESEGCSSSRETIETCGATTP